MGGRLLSRNGIERGGVEANADESACLIMK
jgi:hypothetical protein